jgi:hypothetical protein
MCSNIGSIWGPRLPEGCGITTDQVPLLGKWSHHAFLGNIFWGINHTEKK